MNGSLQLQDVATAIADDLECSFVSYVGKGTFKETYQLRSDSKALALKVFRPQHFDPERAIREVAALECLEHPSIAKLIDHGKYLSKTNISYFYMVEEFLSGGSLSDRISEGIISRDDVLIYAKHLVNVISYLKEQKKVHRDIKPDNIMFRGKDLFPVLVDFGIVRDLCNVSLTQTWLPQGPGTPLFSAPEQLLNEKYLIDWRTDQFSLGIVLGICLTGIHPYRIGQSGNNAIVERIAKKQECSPVFVEYAIENGLEWILKMIKPWPIQRFFSPSDIVNSLRG